MRVADEPGRDFVEKSDLGEQTKRFRIVGDSSRQAEKAGVAFEDDHPDPSGGEEVGEHQPDRSRSNDRDLRFQRRIGLACVLEHVAFLPISALPPRIN